MADAYLITSIDAQGHAWTGRMMFANPITHDSANGPIKAGDRVTVDHDMSDDDTIAYIRVGDFQ